MIERSQNVIGIAKQAGADLAGIADLEGFRGKIPAVPVDLLAGYRFALSAAVRLDDAIVSAITDHPTLEYAELYRQMNKRLDGIAARVVERIEAEGAHAREVPASAIIEEERLLGALSHKAVARMAGLGWKGKSNAGVRSARAARDRADRPAAHAGQAGQEPVRDLPGMHKGMSRRRDQECSH